MPINVLLSGTVLKINGCRVLTLAEVLLHRSEENYICLVKEIFIEWFSTGYVFYVSNKVIICYSILLKLFSLLQYIFILLKMKYNIL